MAFPTINAQQEINNRILEDLQLKKQLLQKGVPALANLSTTNASNPGMPQFMQATQPLIQSSDIPANSPARTAYNHSFGSFVPQDSVFGNSILPVLPRFENPTK